MGNLYESLAIGAFQTLERQLRNRVGKGGKVVLFDLDGRSEARFLAASWLCRDRRISCDEALGRLEVSPRSRDRFPHMTQALKVWDLDHGEAASPAATSASATRI